MRRVGLLGVLGLLITAAVGARAGATPISPSPFTASHVSVAAGYTPVVGDFDGDGRTDVFWYHPGPGADYVWWGSAPASTFGRTHSEFVVNGTYRPLVGDFNGDGRADVLWNPVGAGHISTWYGRADRTFTGADAGAFPAEAAGTVHVVGDFNGDGAADVLTYIRGGVYVIAEGGASGGNPFLRYVTGTPIKGDYTPIPGDFNGDGRTDIYWAARHGGSSYLWVAHPGAKFVSWRYESLAPATSFAGEFTGDGNDDLFAYGPGAFAERILPGAATNASPITFATVVVPNVVGTYTPVVGDFSGNAKTDVIWYAPTRTSSPYWIAH